jgi:dihydroorotase
MEKDPLIPEELHNRNIIESVSGICNVYLTDQKGNMFTGVHGCKQAHEQKIRKKQEKMKEKFAQWRIELKWVILFQHVDDFNACHSGKNFLGSVSNTVAQEHSMDSPKGYVMKVWQTLTFCQCKVLEDACVGGLCSHHSKWNKKMVQ